MPYYPPGGAGGTPDPHATTHYDNGTDDIFSPASETSGISNIGIGASAANSVTTGSSNIGIGENSLTAVTTTSDNTALGNNTGITLTGSRNTILGSGAGLFAGDISNNILIGYTVETLAASPFNNNIVIGHDVQPFSGTGSNQLGIGNLLFGNNINGTAQTISTGNIGIGTKTFPGTGTWGLFFGDGTAPASLGSNTAGIYANDIGGTVQMFAINEAGEIYSMTGPGPLVRNQAPGMSFTIATGQFGLHGMRLTLASTEQAVLVGTSRLIIAG